MMRSAVASVNLFDASTFTGLLEPYVGQYQVGPADSFLCLSAPLGSESARVSYMLSDCLGETARP